MDTQINIVHADTIQASSSVSALSVPRQIPPPPRDFTGREADIKELLEKFSQGATITGLRGMGGVGKTALALVLAEKLSGNYPGGQLFLNMQGTSNSPLKPEDAMAHVILSYLGSIPKDFNGLSGLYQAVLSGKKALILLDNAASRLQVEQLLPPKGCALLITSRNKFRLSDSVEKDLDVLPLEDAKKLLLEICGRISDHAGELAKLCGCLPLALQNAASALKERSNLRPSGYIERLGDLKTRLKLMEVDASFELSYQLLTPELQSMWSLLSVFPADFDLAGAAAVCEMEHNPAEYALSELVKWSLVDYLPSATGEGGRYRLHDLARDFAYLKMDLDANENARHLHAEHYMKILKESDNIYSQGKNVKEGLKLFDQNWENIQSAHAWVNDKTKQMMKENIRYSASPPQKSILELLIEYSHVGGHVLYLRLHPRAMIKWLETTIDAARLLKDKKMEAETLHRLGKAYDTLGEKSEAINFFENSIEIARNINDKELEGKAMGNLGFAYFNKGEKKRAIELYIIALKIDEEVDNQRLACSVLDSLGQAYVSLGENSSGIEFYERALKITRKIGDRRGEGIILGNMGRVFLELGGLQRATEYLEQAIKISREISDIISEGDMLFNLSITQYRLENKAEAIRLAKEALYIFTKTERPQAKVVEEQIKLWQK